MDLVLEESLRHNVPPVRRSVRGDIVFWTSTLASWALGVFVPNGLMSFAERRRVSNMQYLIVLSYSANVILHQKNDRQKEQHTANPQTTLFTNAKQYQYAVRVRTVNQFTYPAALNFRYRTMLASQQILHARDQKTHQQLFGSGPEPHPMTEPAVLRSDQYSEYEPYS